VLEREKKEETENLLNVFCKSPKGAYSV